MWRARRSSSRGRGRRSAKRCDKRTCNRMHPCCTVFHLTASEEVCAGRQGTAVNNRVILIMETSSAFRSSAALPTIEHGGRWGREEAADHLCWKNMIEKGEKKMYFKWSIWNVKTASSHLYSPVKPRNNDYTRLQQRCLLPTPISWRNWPSAARCRYLPPTCEWPHSLKRWRHVFS